MGVHNFLKGGQGVQVLTKSRCHSAASSKQKFATLGIIVNKKKGCKNEEGNVGPNVGYIEKIIISKH